MKRLFLVLALIMPLFPADQAESFVLEKAPKKSRESKRTVLEDIGQTHADLVKDIGFALDALATVQKRLIKLQRISIDSALDVVSGNYCSNASTIELATKRDEVHALQEKIAQLNKAVDQLNRSLAA